MDTSGAWEPLGETPLTGQFLPFGFFHVRVSKAGYAPAEITMAAANPRHMTLTPEAAAPPRMVLVTPPGNVYAVGVAKQVALPDYWLDKFEVTNAEFKQFVDAGGYRDAKFWKDTFREGTRTLTLEQASARFLDSTGRPGPATLAAGKLSRRAGGLPGRRHQLVRGPCLRAVCRQAPADDLSLVSRRQSRRPVCRHPPGQQFRQPWTSESWRTGRARSVGHTRYGRQRQGVVRERRKRREHALHPRRRVERAELSVHRGRCAESMGARANFRRQIDEGPRGTTCWRHR